MTDDQLRESTPVLTIELATGLLCQVDLIPRQKPFEWHDLTVDENGRGKVTVKTPSSTTTVQGWFRKCGMTVTRFQMTPNIRTWVCYFRLLETEGGGE